LFRSFLIKLFDYLLIYLFIYFERTRKGKLTKLFFSFTGRTKKEKGSRETQTEKLRNRVAKKGEFFYRD